MNDIAAILGIGRATAYKLANSGAFKTIRIGNMIRISRKGRELDLLTKSKIGGETSGFLPQFWYIAEEKGCIYYPFKV